MSLLFAFAKAKAFAFLIPGYKLSTGVGMAWRK
jgi:hypothetical protein